MIFGKHIGESLYYYQGLMDDVKIWNRSLSQLEILESLFSTNYDDGSLIGHWSFNNPPDLELIDLSVNENHGTINGASWSNDAEWSEYIFGCIDSLATNYDPNAIVYDYSCEYVDNGEFYLTFDTDTDDYILVEAHSALPLT